MLSKEDNDAIAAAVTAVESKTSTELVVVVAPASDTYQSFVMAQGLFLGSVIALGLYFFGILPNFPELLGVQILTMALLLLIPFLRHIAQRLVPKRIKHHRAGRRAYEEYLAVSRHVSATTPIVLLYISLAERYAHILPSRLVREKLPDATWSSVIQKLTTSVSKDGLRSACIQAIEESGQLLVPYFPTKGGANKLDNRVIEKKK